MVKIHSMLPLKQAQISSLVRELTSHKPCGVDKKKKKEKKPLGFPPMSGNIFKEYMQINSYIQTEKILAV